MGPIFRDTTPSGSLLSADGHNTAACPCVQRPRSSGERPLPVGGGAGPRRLVSSFRHPGRQQGGHRQQQGQRDPAAPATIQLRPRQGPGQAPAPPPLRRPRQQLPAAGAHHAAGQAAIGLHRPAPAVGTGHRRPCLTLADSMLADGSPSAQRRIGPWQLGPLGAIAQQREVGEVESRAHAAGHQAPASEAAGGLPPVGGDHLHGAELRALR